MRRRLHALCSTTSLGLLLATMAQGPTAYAQPAPSAKQLFDEGVALFERGDVRAACERFAASYAIDHAGGTLYNLSSCHEKDGKFWLAHEELAELAQRATAAGKQDKADVARARMRELEAHLPRLRFVASTKSNVVSITVDGRLLPDESWTAPLFVDFGSHAVLFEAPGKLAVQQSVRVSTEGETASVEIPALVETSRTATPAPPPPPTAAREGPAAPPPAGTTGGARRTVGFVVAGVGLAALGVGAYFGVQAFSQKSDADQACGGSNATCQDAAHTAVAQSKLDDARTSATLSTIGWGVGLVALGVGAYLVLTGGHASPPSPSALLVTPSVGRDGAGAALGGAF